MALQGLHQWAKRDRAITFIDNVPLPIHDEHRAQQPVVVAEGYDDSIEVSESSAWLGIRAQIHVPVPTALWIWRVPPNPVTRSRIDCRPK